MQWGHGRQWTDTETATTTALCKIATSTDLSLRKMTGTNRRQTARQRAADRRVEYRVPDRTTPLYNATAESEGKEAKSDTKRGGGKSPRPNGQVSKNADTYSTHCRPAHQLDPSESRYTLACLVINCSGTHRREHSENMVKKLMPHTHKRRLRQLKFSRQNTAHPPRRMVVM